MNQLSVEDAIRGASKFVPRDHHGSNQVPNVLLQRATASNQVAALDKPELLGPPRLLSRRPQESHLRPLPYAAGVFLGPR